MLVQVPRTELHKEICRQIGMGNILSISGGQVRAIENGIELPVSNGYSVRVVLNAKDYYDVSRMFRRGEKEWVRGSASDVDCFQLSEIAYRAGMFRSWDAEQWPAG